MSYPDAPSGCCSVSSFRLCIQMNHLNATMFVCFSFVNLHMHPGGLVNKMTKIYFFYVSAENIIFTVLAKIFLQFLRKNVFLTKNAFLWFWRENTFLRVW